MKLGPVSKLDKRNKTMAKLFDDDVMSKIMTPLSCFWIFGQFGAIPRSDSRHRNCKRYVFSNSNLLP